MIYLDYNATTPLAPEVRAAMEPSLTVAWGNPSSPHRAGRAAAAALHLARGQVASLVGAQPAGVLFTSSATEANNTALAAALAAGGDCRRKLVTIATEHSSVLQWCLAMSRKGTRLSAIPVSRDGLPDLDRLEQELTPDTAVVSAMWANNETGVINPVAEIARMCAARGILFHCDAVQAAGKLPMDLRQLSIDYLTLSSHKLYGPKGAGALIVSGNAPLTPLHIGGHQESGRRGGTENLPAIAGFGCAAELAAAEWEGRAARVRGLRDDFETLVLGGIPQACVHGAAAPRLPNTVNFGFDEVDAESLIQILDAEGICASAGSACLTNTPTPSHVVQAMTGSYARAGEAVRFSLSHLNTEAEIQTTFRVLSGAVKALRGG